MYRMNDQDIVKCIDTYITASLYNYAVLINGAWGSGKTFFMEHVLLPHLRENENIRTINISLYGMQSREEIAEAINDELLGEAVNHGPLKNLGPSGRKRFVKIATAASSVASRLFLNDDYSKDALAEIEQFLNTKNLVLIFDDLERCSFDVCDALGYINHFVEYADCKVIIVANEEEIGKWQLDVNSEQKYYTASNPHIEIPVEKPLNKNLFSQSAAGKDQQQTGSLAEKKFDKDELKRRVDALFGYNERYVRTKEKVIGITISYQPDLKHIFTVLVRNHIPQESVKDKILANMQTYVNRMIDKDHYNIRTIEFFIEKISLISPLLENIMAASSTGENAAEAIITYSFFLSLEYKMGHYKNYWDHVDSSVEWAEISTEDNDILGSHAIMGFRFIDELLIHNRYNLNQMESICTDYINACIANATDKDDPVNKIRNWYFVPEADTRELVKQIQGRISKGIYHTDIYSAILETLSSIAGAWDDPSIVDETVTIMQGYIEEADEVDEFVDRSLLGSDSESGQIYRHASEQICESLQKKRYTQKKSSYYNLLAAEGDHWGVRIYNEFIDDYRNGIQQCDFIKEVSAEDILDQLLHHSSNESILKFHYYLMDCKRRITIDDQTKANLTALYKIISGSDQEIAKQHDRTRSMLYGLVIEDLPKLDEK